MDVGGDKQDLDRVGGPTGRHGVALLQAQGVIGAEAEVAVCRGQHHFTFAGIEKLGGERSRGAGGDSAGSKILHGQQRIAQHRKTVGADKLSADRSADTADGAVEEPVNCI